LACGVFGDVVGGVLGEVTFGDGEFCLFALGEAAFGTVACGDLGGVRGDVVFGDSAFDLCFGEIEGLFALGTLIEGVLWTLLFDRVLSTGVLFGGLTSFAEGGES